MAKPTVRSALEGAGFKLANSVFNGSGDRIGTAMTHHYTLTRPWGNTAVTHNIFVDEFGKYPDKNNVSYSVTHGGEPFAEGRFDTLRNHRNNVMGGVKDPIGEILDHHRKVDSFLSQQKAQPLVAVTPENMHAFNADWPAHSVGGGLRSEIRTGPDPRNTMQYVNSSPVRLSMRKKADEFDDIIRGNKYAGTCSNCGKAVRDIPESSFRDDKLYQLTPEDDAPDPEMHGDPVNLCGECYVDPEMHEMAHRIPKMFGWHYPGAKPGSCPDCDRSIMEEADDDLRPQE